MDIIQLREHRAELSKVAFEAKARLVAADDETRSRTAKTKSKDWLTTIEGDQVSSDAINVIETRKKRMSKMDRLRAQLVAAKIDEATINEMIGNLEKTATADNLRTVTFKVEKTKTSEEIEAIQVEEKPPFDPSTIKFG